jgi:hypothetical protein
MEAAEEAPTPAAAIEPEPDEVRER